MRNKIVHRILVLTLFLGLYSGAAYANDLDRLFKQVQKLKIERHGYVLGKKLNKEQIKIAAANPVEANADDTFKFKNNTLFVVAQKKTNRVLVMYEQFEGATQKKIQGLVGDLYMNFDDPTVLAHDKVVYWAYAEKGKITSQAFEAARKDKKKLTILATVKLISDIKIMEASEKSSKGQAYYIISSDPILKFFNDQKS